MEVLGRDSRVKCNKTGRLGIVDRHCQYYTHVTFDGDDPKDFHVVNPKELTVIGYHHRQTEQDKLRIIINKLKAETPISHEEIELLLSRIRK